MRKLLFLMVIIIALLPLCSCNGSGSDDIPPYSMNENYYMDTDTDVIQDLSGYFGLYSETDTDTDSEEEYINPYSIWGEMHTIYSSLSDDSYNRLIDAAETDGYFGPDTLLMLSGDSELSLCNSFFSESPEDIYTIFEAIGYTSPQYRENGGAGTISATNANGESEVLSFNFDGKNTAELVYEKDDQLEFIMSVCVTENYWAKVYKGIRQPCEIHVVGYLDGDVYMYYEPEQNLEHDMTLFGNEGLVSDEAFSQDLEYSMIINQDEFTRSFPKAEG